MTIDRESLHILGSPTAMVENKFRLNTPITRAFFQGSNIILEIQIIGHTISSASSALGNHLSSPEVPSISSCLFVKIPTNVFKQYFLSSRWRGTYMGLSWDRF